MKFFDRKIERQLRELPSLPPSDSVLFKLQAKLGQLTPEWAEKQYRLGRENLNRAKGDPNRNRRAAIAELEGAIAYFKNALHFYTTEAFPNERTRVLCELGDAYWNLSEKERGTWKKRGAWQAHLKAAVDSYETALQIAKDSRLDDSWIEEIKRRLKEILPSLSPSFKDRIMHLLAHVRRLLQAIPGPRVVLGSVTLATFLVTLVLMPLVTGVAEPLRLTLSFNEHRPQPGAVWIHTAVWSPNGKYIAVLWDDNIVQVWDSQTKKVIFQPEGGWGAGITWSPDSKFLAGVGLNDTVKIWDVSKRGDVYTSSSYDAPIEAIAWSPAPASTLIAFVGHDGTTYILDFATKVTRKLFSNTQEGQMISSLAWSPDGKYLVSGSEGSKGLVQTWDSSTGERLLTCVGHRGSVASVSWSSDGEYIASAGYDGQVFLWNAKTCQQIGHPVHQSEPVLAVAWSPKDSTYLALASYDGSVQIWTRRGQFIARYPSGQQYDTSGIHNGLFTVAWSPNEKFIVTGGAFGGILAVQFP